jgi:hypothetical protein
MLTESLKNNKNIATEEILNETLENLNKKANLKDTTEVVNKICNILISIKSPFHNQCKMTGTWILTESMMQSMNLPWTIMSKIKTTMNQMEKMLIIEKTWTMMKTSTITDLLQDQEEATTRTKPQLTPLITSSTTSLPMNNEHHLETENVSSAERRTFL